MKIRKHISAVKYMMILLFILILMIGSYVFFSKTRSGIEVCNDIQNIQNIQNLTQRNSCYEHLALTQNKLSYCDKIETPDPFQSGRMTCYIKMAEQTGNTSLCFTYSRYNSAAICLRTIASSTNDSSVCKMDDMEPDVCYLEFAVKRKHVEVCNNISSIEIRGKCVDEITKGIKYYCLNYEAC